MTMFKCKQGVSAKKLKGPLILVLKLVLLTSVPLVHSEPLGDGTCKTDRWAPYWINPNHWRPGSIMPGHRKRMERHRTFMRSAIPSEYRGQKNPLTLSKLNLNAGGKLYRLHCAACHGALGMGNGHYALALNPSPTLLAYMVRMPMVVDEYLLWSISEGGRLFGTDMPAFKKTLSKAEAWQIILFMRRGFQTAGLEGALDQFEGS